MRIVLDNNVLIHVMGNADAGPLHHPETGHEVDRLADRAAALLDRATQADGRLLIPAIVLTEYLLGFERESYSEHMAGISASTAIEILPFDETAAIE